MSRSVHVLLFYFVAHLGLIFFIYPEDIIACAEEGHWVPILVGFAVHVFFLWLFVKGLSLGGNRDMVSLYLGLGKAPAVLLLLPVFVYYAMVDVITVRAYSEIVSIVFLEKTPLWAVMALLFLIPVWLANAGIRPIFYATALVAIVCLPLFLFIFAASFQSVDWRYFFPLFDRHYGFLWDSSFYKSFFAFAGVFLFLGFVQPYFTFRIRGLMWASVLLVPFFLFSVYIPVLTFGEATASNFHYPFVVTLDTLQINWLMFERVTVFFLMSLLTFVMLLVALVLWQSVELAVRFFPRMNRGWTLLVLSAIVFGCCLRIRSWHDIELLFMWNTWIRAYIMLVVPATVYWIGRRAKKEPDYESIPTNS
ncbi:GerAB/ArcD/ProY family transporter [Cohnella thailandensis]|uniref:GerAB/ArcD/ProY family transporter n=1 Tax=Cohnella thailandensis TaxID=557557 RepID=A0A841SWJ0_9BACL|nr:GerAB/ArcD/ProY family transporter [Cohnella thailandensis]MBB6635602.1 GerAB/ArcD/ProY family transporter [Cohnella thailandensis]MBP1974982.1 hypothetical protein [Cohnella thailandensis]